LRPRAVDRRLVRRDELALVAAQQLEEHDELVQRRDHAIERRHDEHVEASLANAVEQLEERRPRRAVIPPLARSVLEEARRKLPPAAAHELGCGVL
jgi:hypothetical protein